MLRSTRDLESYRVEAEDGPVGAVSDFLFDDERWTIRYLVTDTGSFFEDRRVLISPISFRRADWSTRAFHLALTRDKVKASPSIDVDEPVSRQRERDYYRFYGWPEYWGHATPYSWGVGPDPGSLVASGVPFSIEDPDVGDHHLRSAHVVTGYHVQGSDGEIGHVSDLIVDDQTWDIRYLVVDTSNWWVGKKVLVSPRWADRVSWEDSKVFLGLPRETIRSCPEWNPSSPVNREYELRMFDYYGRPTYWQAPAPIDAPGGALPPVL